MKVGEDVQHFPGNTGVSVQLVRDEEIIQCRLQYEGCRLLQNVIGGQRRAYQQLMHRLPRGVVADGDGGMKNDAALVRLG